MPGRLGELLVGGQFAAAGGTAIGTLARWDGAAWHALGGPLTIAGIGQPRVTAIVVQPDQQVVVGGTFAGAGGVAARNVPRWTARAGTPVPASCARSRRSRCSPTAPCSRPTGLLAVTASNAVALTIGAL